MRRRALDELFAAHPALRSAAEAQVSDAEAASNFAASNLFDPGLVQAAASQLAHLRKSTHGLVRAHGWRIDGLSKHAAGDFLGAARAFLRAEREAGDQRGFFATGAIDGFARVGQLTRVRRLGSRLWNTIEEPALKLRLAAAMVNASTFFDDHQLGRLWVRRGSELLEAGVDGPIRGPYLNAFAAHELYFRNPTRAKALAQEALGHFPEGGYAHALIRFNVAQADLLLGELDSALNELIALRADLKRGDRGRLEELTGDLYLKLQMPDAALDAYAKALPLHRRYGQPHNVANCLYGSGLAKQMVGERTAAKRWFRRAEQAFRALENPVSEMLAAVGSANCEPIHVAGAKLRSLEKATRHQPRGIAHLQLTRALVQADPSPQTIGAHRRLARAVGLAALDWESHYAEAKLSDRPNKAFAKMLEAIQNERRLRRSTESQMRLLADRQAAISDYLGFLLEEGDLKMLIEVVRQTRSAALIDEMSLRAELPEGARRILDELRESWASFDADGSSRRAAGPALSSHWMRSWTELSRTISLPAPREANAEDDACLQFELMNELVTLTGESIHRVDVRDLESALRWWNYELAAPLMDRQTPAKTAMAELEKLRNLLPSLSSSTVLPEGLGWSVPWSLVVEREIHADFLLDLNPADEFPEENVAIWYHAPPDLPLIEKEVEMVRRRFPQAKVFRTVEEIRNSCAVPWKWIHVACHADFREENPMFSALHLQDGPIWAAEVAKLPLRAERVVLSACDTGRLGSALKYEPQGWVRAFRARGAREVLASQWPLDDEAGYLFFQAFYDALASYNNVSAAVAAARASVRRRFEHPYFWGAPALYGRPEH